MDNRRRRHDSAIHYTMDYSSPLKHKSFLTSKSKSKRPFINKYRLKHKQLISKLRNRMACLLQLDLFASLIKPAKWNSVTVSQQPAFFKSKLVQDWVISQQVYAESRKTRMQNRGPGSAYGSPVLKTPFMNHLPMMESDVWSASDLTMRRYWQFKDTCGYFSLQDANQNNSCRSLHVLDDGKSWFRSQSKVSFYAANEDVETNQIIPPNRHVSHSNHQKFAGIKSQFFDPIASHVSHHVPRLPHEQSQWQETKIKHKEFKGTKSSISQTKIDTTTALLPTLHRQSDVSLDERMDFPTSKESPLANRPCLRSFPIQQHRLDPVPKSASTVLVQSIISHDRHVNIQALEQDKYSETTVKEDAIGPARSKKPLMTNFSSSIVTDALPECSSPGDERVFAVTERGILHQSQSPHVEYSPVVSKQDCYRTQMSPPVSVRKLCFSKSAKLCRSPYIDIPQSNVLDPVKNVGSCPKLHCESGEIPPTKPLRHTITTHVSDSIHTVLSDDLSELCRTWPTWCVRH